MAADDYHGGEPGASMRSADAQTSLRALLNMAGGEGPALRELRVERATLEDVFLQLTGRRIRE